MVPRTFPSTYQTANGETRMVVFFLSSVSGLRKWVDYIPVKFTMLETQVNNSYNNNGVILVDPLSSTTNRQAWVDYVPVFVDENDTAAWRVDANGFIPVGFSTKPTLNLDFAGTKTLDSRITFTRASNATYFDANGVMQTASNDVARFDHNPTTLQSLGLLIEEQRTNLILQSEDFSTAWLVTRSSVTTNAVVAPNGTLTGDTLVANTDNNTHFIRQGNFTFTSGVTYTFSVFVKAAGYSFVAIRGDSTSGVLGAAVYFSLTDGSVTQSASGVTATSTAVGNGWYRLSVTATATATESTGRPTVYLTNVGTGSSFGVSFAGDGTSGIYIWGAQLEAGAFPTSYIPTTTAAATRNADVATMTGTNFSSWYNATEGSFFTSSSHAAFTQRTLSVTDGTQNNSMQQFIISNNAGMDSYVSGSFQGSGGVSGTYAVNTLYNFVSAYKENNAVSAINGSLGTTDTSYLIPTVNRLLIRQSRTTATTGSGHIRRIAYYPVRLSNDQLQALTR
jgi:hypothetical protein